MFDCDTWTNILNMNYYVTKYFSYAVQIARLKVSDILKSAKPPQRNITHEEEEALKELKKDKNIVSLKMIREKPQLL